MFPWLNPVLTSHIHLLSPVLGSDLGLVIGLGLWLSESSVVFLSLPSSTSRHGWLQVPRCAHLLLLGSLVLCAPTHQYQRASVSAPWFPLKLAKKSPASYNFAAAAFWRPSQTRTARLRVLSNRPTHNHPSKRAVSPEVKSPVFNIKPSTGPVFLFPGDSGT